MGCSFYKVRGHDCRKGEDGGGREEGEGGGVGRRGRAEGRGGGEWRRGREEGSGRPEVFGEKDESGSLSINAA